jgi:hypothetical protein
MPKKDPAGKRVEKRLIVEVGYMNEQVEPQRGMTWRR